ncbi:hypothetical protein BC939DRAFT_291234 [Gamsiella multidivaricata]|uniref:uncharacterized protein n=1 Tax=Gamsiella multidivaricata TaxID=101098 RepID=UPI002220163E|nr:uncharacterized protein BC939DRAFT_291234 [Gamsiella multidivaricata]KAI7818510.1 hypothetical protein BC939DRAFT_291234 [Gamsiella multidivaricata]
MNYFAAFPDFSLRQGEHLRNAFKRLAREKGWSDGMRASEKTKFYRCVTQHLNDRFNKLEHFQDLCQKLFDSTPSSITKCKALLITKYVNIWDIVEGQYKYFEHYADFRKYTSKGRTFDRREAKGLLLNVFLRHLK